MKRRRMKIMVVAIIMALSLSTGGFATGAWIPPSADTNDVIVIPVFTTHPQSQLITVGQDVIFSVAVTGTPSPALQWQVSTNGGLTWTDIEGQTSNTLRIMSAILSQNNSKYRIVATTETSEVASAIANLAVVTAPITNAQIPIITAHPADTSVITNNSATLSVTAQITDSGTLTYQWFSNTTDRNTGGTAVRGATSRTFTPPTNTAGTTYYYVVITNTNNYVTGSRTTTSTSNTARVIVSPLVNAQTPNIITQPESVEVVLDNSTVLSATAQITDRGSLSFQWFSNTTDSNSGGTLISGATKATFVPATETLGVTYYYVVVTNTNTSVNGAQTAEIASQAVSVAVITTPDAPSNPGTIVDGNNVTLFWEAPENNGGSEIIGYQVSDNVVTFWVPANGDYHHTFERLKYESEYTFRVRAINAAGNGEVVEVTTVTEEREAIDVDDITNDDDTDSSYITVTDLDSSNMLLWIGLGTLAPLGTGTGIYFWRRNKR